MALSADDITKGDAEESGTHQVYHKTDYHVEGGDQPKKNEHHSNIFHPSLVLRNKDETPDPESLELEEEIPGWHGYVEWEKYPERKKAVKEYMKKFDFPGVSFSEISPFLHFLQ